MNAWSLISYIRLDAKLSSVWGCTPARNHKSQQQQPPSRTTQRSLYSFQLSLKSHVAQAYRLILIHGAAQTVLISSPLQTAMLLLPEVIVIPRLVLAPSNPFCRAPHHGTTSVERVCEREMTIVIRDKYTGDGARASVVRSSPGCMFSSTSPIPNECERVTRVWLRVVFHVSARAWSVHPPA